MKTLFTLLLALSLGVAAQAQTTIKINDYPAPRGLVKDMATIVRIKCIGVDIDLTTANQQPGFLITLLNSDGQELVLQNVYYQDMVNACIKNNIPENQHAATIAGAYAAVFCGTKEQKIQTLTTMMAGYGIVPKPANEQ